MDNKKIIHEFRKVSCIYESFIVSIITNIYFNIIFNKQKWVEHEMMWLYNFNAINKTIKIILS